MLIAPLPVRQALNRSHMFLASIIGDALDKRCPGYKKFELLCVEGRYVKCSVDGTEMRVNFMSKKEFESIKKGVYDV